MKNIGEIMTLHVRPPRLDKWANSRIYHVRFRTILKGVLIHICELCEKSPEALVT